ncbi:MAG: hypothetical protein ACYTG0_32915 [Planctomycetota bacterium]|jgi:hypothetical protein
MTVYRVASDDTDLPTRFELLGEAMRVAEELNQLSHAEGRKSQWHVYQVIGTAEEWSSLFQGGYPDSCPMGGDTCIPISREALLLPDDWPESYSRQASSHVERRRL